MQALQFCGDTRLDNTQVYNSISEVDEEQWDSLVKANQIYLSRSYLRSIERELSHIQFRYVQFYEQDKLVGIAYFQLIPISEQEINFKILSKKLGGFLPSSFQKWLKTRILICGNAFATGENGFVFDEDNHPSDSIKQLNRVIQNIVELEKKKNNPISLSIVKEFWSSPQHYSSDFKLMNYHELSIDVNMVLEFQPSWESFDDYLGSLNSKFRTKYKQVLKKSSELTIIDFDKSLAQDRLDDINDLYNRMVNKASFSFGRLNGNTLLAMKSSLGDAFFFRGYLFDDKLVGFATATHTDGAMDGNFIGIDFELNKRYAVYQRILYDFIEHGISNNLNGIRFGRTAEEIKSGVGALPVDMKFYAKHHNVLKNALLKPFLKQLKPSEFRLRNPFKQQHKSPELDYKTT